MNNTLDILYIDDDFVAVNKPSGLLVHRTELASQETDAVVQRLNAQLGKWVYPVHRLDRATSGVLILALSTQAANAIAKLFENGDIVKEYLSIVRGHVEENGIINHPLAKLNEQKGRARFKIEGTEKEAITHFNCLETYLLPQAVSKYPTTRCCLVNVKTEQGRKHQIRRHFKHIRHPLIGDTRYGCRHHNKLFTELRMPLRLLLHAQKIQFTHPFSKENITINASIPDDFQTIIQYLQKNTAKSSTSISVLPQQEVLST